MENEKKIELNYKLLIVFAIAVPLILGTAYAYFLPKIAGDEPSTIQGTVIKDIDFKLITPEENGYINATDLVPINDGRYSETNEVDDKAAKGSFSIESLTTNERNLSYSISFTNITISEALKTEDFRWRLEKVNSSGTVTATYEGNFASINNDTSITLKTNLILAPGATDNYIIKLWITNTNFDQCPDPTNKATCIINTSFSGKISVEAEYTI